ncbi:uncharacterized protein N7479_009118 [Penicillium vulpinum]|nr:uncharacterized protein N7479_009118 [Penicillium vulpinum]KAJ5950705.1 hypothetical protein N7479_009118 [Penicillium vulpinum]
MGTVEERVIKAATAALVPIGPPQRDAMPEGAAGCRSQAGGWGPQNGGRMGAVFGPPLAVV